MTGLSPVLAPVCCALVTASYVGSLYLFAAHRIGGRQNSRYDDSALIWHRLTVASISSAVSLIAAAAIIASTSCAPSSENVSISTAGPATGAGDDFITQTLRCTAHALGLGPPSAPASTKLVTNSLRHGLAAPFLPLILTASLYLGPLSAIWLEGSLPFQRNFSWQKDLIPKVTRPSGLRNFVVGPVTEELVFRSCVLALSRAAGQGRWTLVFVTPSYFSIAHAHHAWESYVAEGRTQQALRSASIRAAFQLVYTGIFGWYANYLFLRTGSVGGPILSHMFCNVMGLPDISTAAAQYPKRKRALQGALLCGLALFCCLLRRLTEPHLFGSNSMW